MIGEKLRSTIKNDSDKNFRDERVRLQVDQRGKDIQANMNIFGLINSLELYHFMYDNYEPQYWWFECFDYLRRLALTGLMVIILPGSALQGFIGVLIALGGLMSYTIFRPFTEDASDNVAMATQLSTFFVFFSALMVQVDVVYHRSGFAALLTVVTFVPPFIPLCRSLLSFYGKMIKSVEPEPQTSASARDDESSPTSPLAPGAPPHEDEEQPAATDTD